VKLRHWVIGITAFWCWLPAVAAEDCDKLLKPSDATASIVAILDLGLKNGHLTTEQIQSWLNHGLTNMDANGGSLEVRQYRIALRKLIDTHSGDFSRIKPALEKLVVKTKNEQLTRENLKRETKPTLSPHVVGTIDVAKYLGQGLARTSTVTIFQNSLGRTVIILTVALYGTNKLVLVDGESHTITDVKDLAPEDELLPAIAIGSDGLAYAYLPKSRFGDYHKVLVINDDRFVDEFTIDDPFKETKTSRLVKDEQGHLKILGVGSTKKDGQLIGVFEYDVLKRALAVNNDFSWPELRSFCHRSFKPDIYINKKGQLWTLCPSRSWDRIHRLYFENPKPDTIVGPVSLTYLERLTYPWKNINTLFHEPTPLGRPSVFFKPSADSPDITTIQLWKRDFMEEQILLVDERPITEKRFASTSRSVFNGMAANIQTIPGVRSELYLAHHSNDLHLLNLNTQKRSSASDGPKNSDTLFVFSNDNGEPIGFLWKDPVKGVKFSSIEDPASTLELTTGQEPVPATWAGSFFSTRLNSNLVVMADTSGFEGKIFFVNPWKN